MSLRRPTTPLSPEDLLDYCKQTLPEDSRGFELLVAQYKHLVFRTAYRMMGNREDADDQAQETFIKVYHAIKSVENPQTLTPWIYRITVNTCLDALREQKRNPGRWKPARDEAGQDVEENADIPDHRAPSPEEAVLQNELVHCLEEALTALDSVHRAMLTLRDIEDRPYDEIAKTLGLGLSAVKMRIHRARLLFRQLLDQVCPEVWKSPVRESRSEGSAVETA
ncbi:MAG: RNA polymerase sigma factor [Acidobacteriota bacterium]